VVYFGSGSGSHPDLGDLRLRPALSGVQVMGGPCQRGSTPGRPYPLLLRFMSRLIECFAVRLVVLDRGHTTLPMSVTVFHNPVGVGKIRGPCKCGERCGFGPLVVFGFRAPLRVVV